MNIGETTFIQVTASKRWQATLVAIIKAEETPSNEDYSKWYGAGVAKAMPRDRFVFESTNGKFIVLDALTIGNVIHEQG